MSILNWISSHMGWAAFAASEVIALLPGLKSNSVVECVSSILKSLGDALDKALHG